MLAVLVALNVLAFLAGRLRSGRESLPEFCWMLLFFGPTTQRANSRQIRTPTPTAKFTKPIFCGLFHLLEGKELGP